MEQVEIEKKKKNEESFSIKVRRGGQIKYARDSESYRTFYNWEKKEEKGKKEKESHFFFFLTFSW